MSKKIGMISLGCNKNQIDAEIMLAKLAEQGFEITDEVDGADAVIVNTCGFIEDAKKEAIENILDMAELKKEGVIGKIIVTGCLAERYREEILSELPEVDAVVGLGSNKDIAEICDRVLAGVPVVSFGEKTCLPLDSERMLTTPNYYAYLKIAEGCSNHCTYCAIPKIRGEFRSRQPESILKEAMELAKQGVKELVVIAQDTSRYGEDLYGKSMLPELLRQLCRIENLKWIRTLYCYPERITDELLETIASEEKLVKYLEIPIQHSDGDILKSMKRWGDEEKLENLFKHIREKIPNVILRTTLITGFPSETQEQFNSLAEFIKRVRFDRLGCFAYSREEGTKAYDFPNQIDEETANHRADIIMEQQMLISAENNEKLINAEFEAVVEGFDRFGECYFGRTPNDAPDIDGKVFFTSETPLKIGDYVKIKITDTLDYDLIGEVIADESAE